MINVIAIASCVYLAIGVFIYIFIAHELTKKEEFWKSLANELDNESKLKAEAIKKYIGSNEFDACVLIIYFVFVIIVWPSLITSSEAE